MNKNSFFSAINSFRNPEFKQQAFQRKCFTAIASHLKWLVTDFELTDDHYHEGRVVSLEVSKTKVADDLDLVIATEIDLRGHILTYVAFHAYKPKPAKPKEDKVDDTSKVNEPTGFGFNNRATPPSGRNPETPWPVSMDPQDTETHTVLVKFLKDLLPTLSINRPVYRSDAPRGADMTLVDYLEQDPNLYTALKRAEFQMFFSEGDRIFTVAMI